MSENEEKKVQEEVERKAEEAVENIENVEEKTEETENKEEENVEKVESQSTQKKEKKPINALRLFYKPATAIKNAVKNNYWKSGLLFLLVYFLIVGMVAGLQFIQMRLSSYDWSIKYAQETLDAAEERYKEYQTTHNRLMVEKYEEELKEAKSEKWDIFKEIEFYLEMTGRVLTAAITTIIQTVLLILLLFLLGKLLKGQGKFSQIIAGVGLAVNIKYISLIVLPLIAKLPLLGSVIALSSVVTALFLLLIYFVFKNTFEFDEDRSVVFSVLAMAIMLLVVNLVADGITTVVDFIERML